MDLGFISPEDYGFSIYIHGPKTIDELDFFINRFNISGIYHSNELPIITEISTRHNKRLVQLGHPTEVTIDDFNDYDYVLSASPESYELERIIEVLNAFLSKIWSQGWAAICACHFEHLLIHEGGYKAKTLPWLEYYSKLEDDQ